jgi:peptidoglycan/LPS O-acetylase OafA/YrhL
MATSVPAGEVAVVASIVVSLGMADLFTRWVDAPTLALSSRVYRNTRARLLRRQAHGAVRP